MKLPAPDLWTRVSPLFDELLDLDAAQHAKRLHDLGLRDPAAAGVLASLLSKHDETVAADFLADGPLHPSEAPSLAGTQLGAYVIESLLGHGGMGSVWTARRADGRFKGTVAVKLLHLSLVGRTAAARFEQEGAILAKLAHPGIARLLDAGITDGGQPYLVLERVEGQRIDLYCNERRLGIDQRLALFEQVLAAVSHAHSHLVVHRDIKPTNILVDREGRVKLLDFGIAKLLDYGDDPAALHTVDGTRALTPYFAAPEQLLGGPITTATDVFSLGVLLYQLLVGQHPIHATGDSPAQSIRAALDTDALPLSGALKSARAGAAALADIAGERNTTVPRLRKRLRGDLETILVHTLRKSASERYQSVAALSEDLRRFLSSQPVAVRADSLGYRCAKFIGRNRLGVISGVAVTLSIVVGLAGTILLAQRASHERDHAWREARHAKGSTEFITSLLQGSAEKPLTLPELLERGEHLVERQFAADPEQSARLQLMLASVYGQAMLQKKAENLLLRAQANASKVNDVSLQVDVECELAMQRGDSGALLRARAMLDSAILRMREQPERDASVLAGCLHGRGQVHDALGDLHSALADVKAALGLLDASNLDQRHSAAIMRASLADLQGRLGNAAEADRQYRSALGGLESMGLAVTEDASTIYNNLGVLLRDAGQFGAAKMALQHAADISRQLNGVDPMLEGNLAGLYTELGQPSEALPLAVHALAEAQARGNGRSVPKLALLVAQATCLTEGSAACAARIASARAHAEQLGEGDPALGAIELLQARMESDAGQFAAARDHLTQALAVLGDPPGTPGPWIQAVAWRALAEVKLGQLDAASRDADLAVSRADASRSGFEHSAWLADALLARGSVERALGRSATADETGRHAMAEMRATVGRPAASVAARAFAREP